MVTLGILLAGFLIFIVGYDLTVRVQELEEESLADKEVISHLTEELSRHKDWLLTIRDRLEIDF